MIRTTSKKSGFTLVEILIVVIILGILAAIVIPQFTNASQDARRSSLTSQLQTIRSQLELYKLQHLDVLPSGLTASTTDWTQMTGQTDQAGATTGTDFGPYLQATPVNPLNGNTNVVVVTTDPTPGTTSASAACGWVLNSANGKFWATDTNGTLVYDENQ